MSWRRHFFIVMILILAAGSIPPAARAQQAVIPIRSTYEFGKQLTFLADLPAGAAIRSAQVYFAAEGEAQTHTGEAVLDSKGRLTYVADLTQISIRAFSIVIYWFEVTLSDGQSLNSERASLYYEDNRFTWKTREAPGFVVHWYEGDAEFAQSLLDVAQLGLQNIQTILPLTQEDPVDIYVYDSAQEMRATLQASSKNWVGAHTDPDLAAMVVSLPRTPEQRLEMERQIPHELMHLLLYQSLDYGYSNLPIWLNEGLASIAELYPNPDYLVMLEAARRKDELLPMASLCQSFPRDASGAFVAYAQATSFTRYLQQQYGSAGLQSLAQAYSEGLSCERGVQTALGSSLTQLERNWRRGAFRENPTLKAAANLSPWLALLVLAVLFPLGLALVGLRKRSTPQAGNG